MSPELQIRENYVPKLYQAEIVRVASVELGQKSREFTEKYLAGNKKPHETNVRLPSIREQVEIQKEKLLDNWTPAEKIYRIEAQRKLQILVDEFNAKYPNLIKQDFERCYGLIKRNRQEATINDVIYIIDAHRGRICVDNGISSQDAFKELSTNQISPEINVLLKKMQALVVKTTERYITLKNGKEVYPSISPWCKITSTSYNNIQIESYADKILVPLGSGSEYKTLGLQ